MDFTEPMARAALATAALMLLTLLWVRQRGPRGGGARSDAPDTVAAWPPTAVRVLTIGERSAYELLRRSLPGFVVLAQVPLARFLRVPTRHSYGEWLHRVGRLNADLVLCDAGSRVLAVIDVRAEQESERSRQRHERMARVLKAAGIAVYVWREDDLPSIAQLRALFGAMLGESARKAAEISRPMPLIPVAEIEEVLAARDAEFDQAAEPVPSAFMDDMEPTLARR